MPEGTKVDRLYRRLRRKGKSKASAAKIAQAKTGLGLRTGKKPKRVPKRLGKKGR